MSDPDRTLPSLTARRGLLITAAMGAAGAASIVGSSSASAAEPSEGVGPFDGAILNAKDHGAAGDGATDDTAALQAAMDAAGTGGAVFLPSATYLVSGTLRPKAGQLIFGVGTRPIIRSSGEHSIFVANQPVRFQRLELDGNSANTTQPANAITICAILAQGTAANPVVDLEVIDCRIEGSWGDGIQTLGQHSDQDRVVVTDTVVTGCHGFGIRFRSTDHAYVENCELRGNNHGLSGDELRNATIVGCRAMGNNGHGFVFTYSQFWHIRDCRAESNGLVNPIGWGICAGGIYKNPAPPWNSDFSITDNVCDGNGSGGITLDPTLRDFPERILVQNAVVSGNTCRNSQKTNGINVTHSRDVVVSNNTCMDNPYGGIQVSSSSHVLVAGNICSGNDHGIGLGTNDVVIDPGHHVIGINHCYANVGNDVQTEPFNGAYLMSGNRWYGMGGSALPEGSVLADPGTLYEQHDGDTGALYVKESGVNTATGWRRVNGGKGPDA